MKAKQKNSKLITIEFVAFTMAMIWMIALHGKHPSMGEAILIASLLSGAALTAVILLEETFGGYILSSSTRKNLPKFPPAIAVLGLIAYIL